MQLGEVAVDFSVNVWRCLRFEPEGLEVLSGNALVKAIRNGDELEGIVTGNKPGVRTPAAVGKTTDRVAGEAVPTACNT